MVNCFAYPVSSLTSLVLPAVRTDRLAMDKSAAVCRTGVHALVADHGRKPKATGESSPLVGGCLGAFVAFDKSGV